MKGSNTMNYTSTNGINYTLWLSKIKVKNGKSKVYYMLPTGKTPKDKHAKLAELPNNMYLDITPNGLPLVRFKN